MTTNIPSYRGGGFSSQIIKPQSSPNSSCAITYLPEQVLKQVLLLMRIS